MVTTTEPPVDNGTSTGNETGPIEPPVDNSTVPSTPEENDNESGNTEPATFFGNIVHYFGL